MVLVGGPSEALAARQAGFQVRDTLLVLLPGRRVLTAFLCRRPLEGTVAENVLKYGTGGLWIDGCRVACEPGDRTDRLGGNTPKWGTNTYAKDAYSLAARAASPANPSGRWPTNLLLVHGPGCVRVGEKRVRATGPTPSGWDRVNARQAELGYRPGAYQKGLPPAPASRVDADGLETVAAWACQPDCPVRLLDEQGGERTSGRLDRATIRAENRIYGKAPERTGIYEADTGGASRFYPQFSDLASALDWLSRLVNGPS